MAPDDSMASPPPALRRSLSPRTLGSRGRLASASARLGRVREECVVEWSDVRVLVRERSMSAAARSRPARTLEPVHSGLSLASSEMDLASTARDDGHAAGWRAVLHGVDGAAAPGELVALMGSSGCGKTTLLSALASRCEGRVLGRLLVNGAPRPEGLGDACGFVSQDDHLYPTLTVRETLRVAAALRLPRDVSPEQQQRRVDDVIALLHLVACADTRVGVATGGDGGDAPSGSGDEQRVSGGERRRVMIGEVLVANPAVLLLDEPTTGLDAAMAAVIVRMLARLARERRTVVCSIHQPRPMVFAMFTRVILLAAGRVVYSGSPADAAVHFAQLAPVPFVCPETTSVADFLLDITATVGRDNADVVWQRVAYLAEQHKQHARASASASAAAAQSTAVAGAAPAGGEAAAALAAKPRREREFAASWCRQFAVLSVRSWRNYVRNPSSSIVALAQSVALAVMIGLIFWQLPLDQTAPQNRAGVISFILLFQVFSGMTLVINTFVLELGVVHKERESRAYHSSAFFLAKMLTELPLEALAPALFATISYWIVGLNPDGVRFATFLGIDVLAALAATSLSLFVSAATRNVGVANILAPSIAVVMMLFAGFFVTEATIPWALSWIRYVSLVRYAFRALLVTELRGEVFRCNSGAACTASAFVPGLYSCADAPSSVCVPTGDLALSVFEFQDVVVWNEVLVLASFVIVFRVLAYVMVRCCGRPRRAGHTMEAPPTTAEVPPVLAASTPVEARSLEAAVSSGTLDTLPGVDAVPVSDALPQPPPAHGGELGVLRVRRGTAADSSGGAVSAASPTLSASELEWASLRSAASVGSRPSVVQRVTLSWHNVTCTVNQGAACACCRRGGSARAGKHLVLQSSGAVRPGHVLAIMGPSGAGKTSLLNVLAQRGAGEVRGEILVNGRPFDAELASRLSGFVAQADMLPETSTVREVVEFAARLRTSSAAAAREAAQAAIDELGLARVANSRIGSATARGLSGGERRRVSIAQVLVGSPALIFLDEPTSGLDAATSLSLFRLLRRLARVGRTIVCTVHQPRSDIFSHFDELLVLARGQPVYLGASSKLVEYLAALPDPLVCPPNTNPSDFILDAITPVRASETDEVALRTAALVAACRHSLSTDLMRPASGEVSDRDVELMTRDQGAGASASPGSETVAAQAVPVPAQAPWRVQFALLVARVWRSRVRDRSALLALSLQALGTALLMGFVYFQLGFSQSNVRDRQGLLFYMIMVHCSAGIGFVMTAVQRDKVVFLHERSSRMYSPSAYFFAKLVAEFPFDVLAPLLSSCIVYFVAGLTPAADRFFVYAALNVLVALTSSAATNALLTAAPNMLVASIVSPVALLVFALFGGFLSNATTVPDAFIPLEYASFVRFAFAGLAVNEFTGGADVLRTLGFADWRIWVSAVVLVGMIVVWRAIAYVLLRACVRTRFAVAKPALEGA